MNECPLGIGKRLAELTERFGGSWEYDYEQEKFRQLPLWKAQGDLPSELFRLLERRQEIPLTQDPSLVKDCLEHWPYLVLFTRRVSNIMNIVGWTELKTAYKREENTIAGVVSTYDMATPIRITVLETTEITHGEIYARSGKSRQVITVGRCNSMLNISSPYVHEGSEIIIDHMEFKIPEVDNENLERPSSNSMFKLWIQGLLARIKRVFFV